MTTEDNELERGSNGVSSYSLHSWMTDLYSPYLHKLRLNDMSIPGAHNCGVDNEIAQNTSYHSCQDRPIRHQLDNGVRALDLRFRWYNGSPGGLGDKFRAYHGEPGRSLSYIMTAVVQFLQARPGEIVILDVHYMDSMGNFAVPYAAFHGYMLQNYGAYLLPRAASYLKLSEIRSQYPGPRIVLATPKDVWMEKNEIVRDHTYFWDQIRHSWGNAAEHADLRAFIEREVIGNPPFSDYLWSTSATVFNYIHGPKDIIGHLRSWYVKGGTWQTVSNIINFDWCTRDNGVMIRNCIESNDKPGSLAYKITSPKNGEVVYAQKLKVQGIGKPGTTLHLWRSGVGGGYGYGLLTNSIFDIETSIPEGPFTATFRLQDGERLSKFVPDVEFTYWASLPIPTILTPANGAPVNTNKPMISGKNGAPGATVRFYQRGSINPLYGTALVESDGNWSATPSIPLPNGYFQFSCDQTLNGMASDYAQSAFTVMAGTTPRNFRVTGNGNRSVSFAWEAPEQAALGYQFKIAGVGAEVNVAGTTHTAYNLIPGLPVRCAVRSRLTAGGQMSDWVDLWVTPKA